MAKRQNGDSSVRSTEAEDDVPGVGKTRVVTSTTTGPDGKIIHANTTSTTREEMDQGYSNRAERKEQVLEGSSQEEDFFDEQALDWSAIERLPTCDRLRTIVCKDMNGGEAGSIRHVNLGDITGVECRRLVNNIIDANPPQENQRILSKLRERIDRVGIRLPAVEVRYQNLTVQAECYLGSRALPSIWNSVLDATEGFLSLVRVKTPKRTTVPILRDVSGVLKPGRMALLLGPPSSGKTSLLLALANKLDPALNAKGQVTFNGFRFNEFLPQKTCVYVSQHDVHLADMTVRETLNFSARCQGTGHRMDLLTELSRRERELGIIPDPETDFLLKASVAPNGISADAITEYIIKVLSLDVCSDIIVGNEIKRGISGGQKKRVTTGEMIVGPTKTFFMDEISTGLDSSTTFQIMQCLQDYAHNFDATIFVTLLQPAPETYNLFDDVVLLSEGQIIYHGPRDQIQDFFLSCGFTCPERKGIADFLQEVTSRKDQEQYWFSPEPYRYISGREFGEAFKKFHVGSKMYEELTIPVERSAYQESALTFERYSGSKWDLLKSTLAREVLLVSRNKAVNIFMTVRIIIVAMVTSAAFFRTGMHRHSLQDAQLFNSALFLGTSMVMFNGFAELAQTIYRLPVVYKQRDMYLYPPWAYAVSTCIMKVPVSLIESGTWIGITYYTIGFAPAANRLFRQVLLYFWVNQTASGMFRLVAGICRSPIIANTGGNVMLVAVFVLGGFIIPRPEIRLWWIWAFWITPLSYAENGNAVNEFLAPQWEKPGTGGDVHHLGVQYLKYAGIFSRGYWYWIGVMALILFTLIFNILFAVSLSFLSPVQRNKAMISEETLRARQANWSGEDTSVTKSYMPRSLSRASSGKLYGGLRSLSARAESLGSLANGIAKMGFEGRQSTDFANRPSNASTGTGTMSYKQSMSSKGMEGPKRGMILPFQPLVISFDEVCYAVDMPPEMSQPGGPDKLSLLRGVTGAFRPGVLTALVGVSGAGKTTLMDVLAGRKSGGYVDGDIRISGFPKKQETFTRISGYCEQNDVHSPSLTVRESLLFSAWLRLPQNTEEEVRELFVDEVMELGELTVLRDALVGMPGVTGLSTEQRKRLTIAVELVANPSIIFMDEPTSGLDARAAAIVMRAVRNTVDTGRTVVCTIHQPSIDIFEAFDELLLLKRGGRVTYAGSLGSRSHHLIKYFEDIPGVPKIAEGVNPATWMLEISTMGVEQCLGVDFAELYENSDLKKRNKSLVKELGMPATDAKDISFDTKYSQPLAVQFRACLWKQNISFWRTPDYNFVRFWLTGVTAVFFGTILWNFGKRRGTAKDIRIVLGGMYAAVVFLGFSNSTTVQPVVTTERAVLYRERGAGIYSTVPYALAQVLIEVPYCVVQTLIYAIITYLMINLEWTAYKFFWYFFMMFISFLAFTYYGMMAVSITASPVLAIIASGFFYNFFNMFSGFLLPKPRAPSYLKWVFYATPNAWTLYGIITSQFGDLQGPKNLLSVGGGAPDVDVKTFIREYFGYRHDFIPIAGTVMVGMAAVFAGIYILAIKYLNFQRR